MLRLFSGLVFFVTLNISAVSAHAELTKPSAPAATLERRQPLAAKAQRNYPGGRDEEDLKVQEAIPTPTQKIDRRAIEAKVLKINTEKVNSEEAESVEQ